MPNTSWPLRAAIVALLAGSVAAVHTPAALGKSHSLGGGPFNSPGNLLISDQFNNRAIEINPTTNAIVWSFGSGDPSACDPGPHTVIGLNDAERLAGGDTLIAGTGIPAGASPAMPAGCVDNRVIVVNSAGAIIWQYGQAGVAGSGPNQLNVPVFAIQEPNRNILITDQANNRIIEVDRFTRAIDWSYGPTSGPGALNGPNSAELLTNGDILIADQSNNRVIEVNRAGQIVWQYSQGIDLAAFASRLNGFHTLITDSGHSRIFEINKNGHITFQYFTDTAPNSNRAPFPTNAVRLDNGNTEIADQFNHRAIIVDGNGNLVYQYGVTNVSGNAPGLLNAPYTAFTIGDYTGQTVPPPTF